MTTTISDLADDLVLEIFSRVPLTSLSEIRSTCKKWNALSKNQVLSEKAARKQFLGFMIKDLRVCSLRFDLRGDNNNGEFVDPSIKEISILDELEISKAFHCNGLLLCIPMDVESIGGLLVWNPYLGQTKLIQPRKSFDEFDRYAIGYDRNRNHKILRIFGERQTVFGYEIYSFTSNSWKCVHIKPDWYIWSYQRGVSVKGNAYFAAKKKRVDGGEVEEEEDILLCFDFTTETFGPSLLLPFSSRDAKDHVTLSCVRDEHLAVLHHYFRFYRDIWVTKKIDDDPNAVSWNRFTSEMTYSPVDTDGGSFFIDEDHQVAVVFDRESSYNMRTSAFVIGPGDISGYPIWPLRTVYIGDCLDIGKDVCSCCPLQSCELGVYYPKYCLPLVCSSYVPSLVQLQFNQPDYKPKRKTKKQKQQPDYKPIRKTKKQKQQPDYKPIRKTKKQKHQPDYKPIRKTKKQKQQPDYKPIRKTKKQKHQPDYKPIRKTKKQKHQPDYKPKRKTKKQKHQPDYKPIRKTKKQKLWD